MVTEPKPIRLAEAKVRLGRLAELSRKGKTVRFIARSELFEIVHVKRPVVVPASEEELRVCYSDPEENALVNRFGQESIGWLPGGPKDKTPCPAQPGFLGATPGD